MRCLRIWKRQSAIVFFMRGAHEMLINARKRARKTTSAMTENTSDDAGADTYRFAINSFADKLGPGNFTTVGKVSRTSSKWAPRGRSRFRTYIEFFLFFLLRSVNSLRNFSPRSDLDHEIPSRLLLRLNVVLHGTQNSIQSRVTCVTGQTNGPRERQSFAYRVLCTR